MSHVDSRLLRLFISICLATLVGCQSIPQKNAGSLRVTTETRDGVIIDRNYPLGLDLDGDGIAIWLDTDQLSYSNVWWDPWALTAGVIKDRAGNVVTIDHDWQSNETYISVDGGEASAKITILGVEIDCAPGTILRVSFG